MLAAFQVESRPRLVKAGIIEAGVDYGLYTVLL